MQDKIKYAHTILSQFIDALKTIKIDNNFELAASAILNCKGKIVFSGMGKAGHIAQKSASTFCSFGIASCFVHPGEASHGDIGVISHEDILLVISNSGKTREIVEIITLARNINVKCIIGLTGHQDSPIKSIVDICLDMGVVKEASTCNDFNLAPTTSTLVMMAILDTLALVCGGEKNITNELYSLYHHSGYLGAKARNEV